ncbi:hypothetical protein [Halobaculum sp. MBLA0143]|uniref:hypothetical protein n=1 Tax=Halobaculum sp. MBLA0143 TaxID=3079933 RepID=UPI003525B056
MRLWLVERSFDTRNSVTLTYATTDGGQRYRIQATVDRLSRDPATAAVARDEEAVTTTPESDRSQYAAEATRMAERHDPDDTV